MTKTIKVELLQGIYHDDLVDHIFEVFKSQEKVQIHQITIDTWERDIVRVKGSIFELKLEIRFYKNGEKELDEVIKNVVSDNFKVLSVS